MERFASWRIPSKATDWGGPNVTRWRDDGHDALWRAARSELDPARRAALFIQMNDLVVASGAVIPVVRRALVEAVARDLRSRPHPGPLRSGVSRPGTAGHGSGATQRAEAASGWPRPAGARHRGQASSDVARVDSSRTPGSGEGRGTSISKTHRKYCRAIPPQTGHLDRHPSRSRPVVSSEPGAGDPLPQADRAIRGYRQSSGQLARRIR
jgi:hypothetical protein